MRKTIVGAVLASVLAAAACTTAQNTAPAAAPAPPGPTPAAGEVGPGFVGQKQIGAWTLVCEELPENSASSPANGNPVQSQIINKGGQQMLDVKIHVGPRPCFVRDVLEEADQPEHDEVATFRLRGPYGVLSLVFRGRAGIFPLSPLLPAQGGNGGNSAENGKSPSAPRSDISPADLARLNYDGKTITSPVMTCGMKSCGAGIEIPREDEPAFLAAKDIVLQLPPASAGKPPFRINLPTTGLAEAIGAMRTMEK